MIDLPASLLLVSQSDCRFTVIPLTNNAMHSLLTALDEEDEAPYDRTYKDKSDDVIPEKKNFNAGKYGFKAKKKVVEESDEEEGRNPWGKTKKTIRQPAKQDQSDEESPTETRKALFTKSGTVPSRVGSESTPNHSDTEKSSQRSGSGPKNPFLESKTDNYRKGRGAGSDAEPETMSEVLSRLKNKKHAGGMDAYDSDAFSLPPPTHFSKKIWVTLYISHLISRHAILIFF